MKNTIRIEPNLRSEQCQPNLIDGYKIRQKATEILNQRLNKYLASTQAHERNKQAMQRFLELYEDDVIKDVIQFYKAEVERINEQARHYALVEEYKRAIEYLEEDYSELQEKTSEQRKAVDILNKEIKELKLKKERQSLCYKCRNYQPLS